MIAYGSLFVLILLSFSLRLQHPRQKFCFPSKNPCLRIDHIVLHIEYRATSSFVRQKGAGNHDEIFSFTAVVVAFPFGLADGFLVRKCLSSCMDLWRKRMPDGEICGCLLNRSPNFLWLKHIRIRNGNDAIFFDLRNREEAGRTSNQNDSADQCPFFPVFPLHPQSSRIAAAIIRTSFIRCSIGTNSSSPCM